MTERLADIVRVMFLPAFFAFTGLRTEIGLIESGQDWLTCAVIVLVRTRPLARRSSSWTFSGFGVVSGGLGGLFSASGPPLVYQYYRQPLDLETVRDTLVAALAAGSLIRLAMVVPAGQFSGRALWLCALSVPVAMGVTWWLRRHPPACPRETVLKMVCALLLVTGVGLIAPAVGQLWG